jgi:hypothetical protein
MKKKKKEIKKNEALLKRIKKYTTNIRFLVVAITVVLLSLILLVMHVFTKDIVRTSGVNIYYRTYTTEKGWTKWSQNGQINGTDKYAIKAIEIKVKSRYKGNIFYNTYSNKKWMFNDLYSGNTSGDKKHNINKIKMMLSDTLYKKYNIKYRLLTNRKMTEYGYNYYELSGDKEIYKIQIVVEEKEK